MAPMLVKHPAGALLIPNKLENVWIRMVVNACTKVMKPFLDVVHLTEYGAFSHLTIGFTTPIK